MARKKTTSIIKRDYYRNRERIIRFIRRAEKRGYYFDEDILPNIPKRITRASVKRLEKLTPDALYRKSIWVDEETGEFVSGRRRREQESSERSKRAAATRKANKEAEAKFFEAEETTSSKPDITKETGEDTYYPDLYEIAFDNIYEEFISRISNPVTDVFTNPKSGKLNKKRSNVIEASKRAQSSILAIVNKEVAAVGKSVIGKRLEKHWREVELLIDYVLYGSRQEIVNTSAARIIEIITDENITREQKADIEEEAERNQPWESY